MAKPTAPLLSFRSSGQIGKAIVFGSWRGIATARQYVKPANPNTTAQQTSRTTFATLREMWKFLASDGRLPWDAFASGRPFLGLNAFIGENQRVVRGDADFQDFVGSPGARGGISPDSVTSATGGVSGEIDVTFVDPTLPAGWSITNHTVIAFPDQDPALDFGGPLVVESDAAANPTVTLGGLGSAVLCVYSGFIELEKPDGKTAYSIGVTGTETSAA